MDHTHVIAFLVGAILGVAAVFVMAWWLELRDAEAAALSASETDIHFTQ